jgi:hypothetical protein
MENTSKHQFFDGEWPQVNQDTAADARRYGDLVWADGNLFVYNYKGALYVMEPPEELTAEIIGALEDHPAYRTDESPVQLELEFESQAENETAPVYSNYDPAVLMHLTSELAYSLRETCSFLRDRMVGTRFTMQEHNAVMAANDLLGVYAEEYGVDWSDLDEQDKLLRA